MLHYRVRWLTKGGCQLGFGWNCPKLNVLGAEPDNKTGIHLCYSNGPDSYQVYDIEFRIFLLSWEYVGGRGYRKYVWNRRTHNNSTRQGRILFWDPTGNMGLAFADSSFLDWVSFLRQRVPSLAVCCSMRWYCRKLKRTQRQPPRACGVVGCSLSPELGVSSYRYIYAAIPCQRCRESIQR